MIRIGIQLAVLVLTLIGGTNAFAITRVQLVTVSGGNTLIDASGATALLLENSDTPNERILFEYGSIDSRQIEKAKGLDAIKILTNPNAKTKATKTVGPIDEKTRLPVELVQRYLNDNQQFREITVDDLALDELQSKALLSGIDADLAAGEYDFDRLSNNATTKLRDRLFDDAVIGKSARMELESTKIELSRDEIIRQAIDEAIGRSCENQINCEKKIQLISKKWQNDPENEDAMGMMQMINLKTEYRSSQELYETMEEVDGVLQIFMPKDKLAQAFRKMFFDPTLKQKPITRYEATFTPKRLRELLIESKHIDPKSALIRVSIQPAAPEKEKEKEK